MEKTAVKMREQEPGARIKNFNEVPLGYNRDEAIKEASRCLQCAKKPCVEGCPVRIDIPAFIKELRAEKFEKAMEIIYQADSLPAVTGRVCPQEEQCQCKCVMGKMGEAVSIGRLERFVADLDMQRRKASPVTGSKQPGAQAIKVAVIGSGPAGLACAADLAKYGYAVTVFEGFHRPGGVLVYGIPEFRLPKDIVDSEVENLGKLGVSLLNNVLIGRALTIKELFQQGYKAVFIGAGAGLPNFMGIPGENLNGVYSANEYLTRVNLMKAYKFPEYHTPVKKGKLVAVVGGGNVAMDSARTALRLGAQKVYLIYRRSEKEMPARQEEVHHARQEGIEFMLLTNPLRYYGDAKGFLTQVECIKMELGEPDAGGRRKPVEKPGSEFRLDIDQAIVAIGNSPNPILAATTEGLKVGRHGVIDADAKCRTSLPGVFAGGDIVTGAATVITAMGQGRIAAASIDEYIKNLASQG